MKKILVLTLVATMVLGLAGSGFAAAPKVITTAFSDAKGHEAEGALAFLAGLGVYKGDKGIGGPARPDDPITRAEFAAVVVRAMGKEKTAQSMANYVPDFADAAQIPSWAWGYVKVASTLGLVKGYEDGTFRANNQVTQAEALAMLVRAIGHESLVKGVWPGNYVTYGYDVGIAGDLEIFANMPATRGEVAQMVENAMEVVTYNAVAEEFADEDNGDGDGEIDDDEDEADLKLTLRAGALRSGWQLWDGTVTAVDEDDSVIKIDGEEVDLASQVVLLGVPELEDLLNYEVEAVGKGDKILFIKVTEEAEVASGVLEEAGDFSMTDEEITLDGEDEYDFDADTTRFYVNGELVPDASDDTDGDGNPSDADEVAGQAADFADWLTANFDSIDGDLKIEITLDDDNVAVAVKAEYYDVYDAVVAEDPEEDDDEDDDLLATIEVGGNTYNINKETKITLNGKAASWDDLKQDMVIYIATLGENGEDAYKIAAYDQTVTGDVESVRWVSAGYYLVKLTVDDEEKTYKTSANFDQADELGGLVTVGLNADGKIRIVLESEAAEDNVLVKDLVAEENNDPLESIVVDRYGKEEFVDLKDEGILTVDGEKYKVVMVGEAVYATHEWDDVNEVWDDITDEKLFDVDSFIQLADVTGGGELRGVETASLIVDGQGNAVVYEVVKVYADDDRVILKDSAGNRIVVEDVAVYDDELEFIGIEELDAEDQVHAYKLRDDTIVVLVKQ